MDGNLAMNYHQENISEADDAAAYEEHFVKNGVSKNFIPLTKLKSSIELIPKEKLPF